MSTVEWCSRSVSLPFSLDQKVGVNNLAATRFLRPKAAGSIHICRRSPANQTVQPGTGRFVKRKENRAQKKESIHMHGEAHWITARTVVNGSKRSGRSGFHVKR